MAALPLLGNTPDTRPTGPDVYFDMRHRQRYGTNWQPFCLTCRWKGEWNRPPYAEIEAEEHLCKPVAS